MGFAYKVFGFAYKVFGFGVGSYFVLSLMDRLWHKDLTEAEALELMEKGIEEVRISRVPCCDCAGAVIAQVAVRSRHVWTLPLNCSASHQPLVGDRECCANGGFVRVGQGFKSCFCSYPSKLLQISLYSLL